MFNTPILFLIFNRPNETKLVFDKIREAKPEQLFIAADGPRAHVFEDKINCALTRDIVSMVDWPCDLKTHFNDSNLGCGKAVSGAITWFFKNVDQGIILEDDCLPVNSFFTFCEKLLHKYKNDERVFQIGGSNFQNGIKRGTGSYYFSAIPHIWGWATWRRTWEKYDFDTKLLPDFIKNKGIDFYFEDEKLKQHWISTFISVHEHKLDTWDHQWTFNVFIHKGVSIIPNKNLVSNIGFGFNATHTKDASDYANRRAQEIEAELVYTEKVEIDKEADYYFYKEVDKFFDHEKATNITLGYKIKNIIVRSIENFLQSTVLPKVHKNPENNILIIKPDAIGDYVIIENLFKYLKKEGDRNNYYLLANHRLKSLIDKNKPEFFKEVIYYDQSIHKHFKPLYSFYFLLRKYKFKRAINLLYSRSKNVDEIVFFSGAPEKIAFNGDTANISLKEKEITDKYYTQLINIDPQNGFIHEFERNKLFLEKVFEVNIPETRPRYQNKSNEKRNSIIICPGSNEEYKIWSPLNFGKLVNELHTIYKNTEIKVLCGPGEENLGKGISEVTKHAEIIDLSDINILISEIASCRMVIANDSAAIHIAVATNTPNICIFNGSRYGRFVPYREVKNSVVLMPGYVVKEIEKDPKFFYGRKFSFNINDVKVEQVVNAAKRLMNE
jgi:ADP-heptose:LPS heptosyltransferase